MTINPVSSKALIRRASRFHHGDTRVVVEKLGTSSRPMVFPFSSMGLGGCLAHLHRVDSSFGRNSVRFGVTHLGENTSTGARSHRHVRRNVETKRTLSIAGRAPTM